MPRKKHRFDNEDFSSAPAYMTTWGDMMSLLLCFFILLYSFSSVDAQKFRAIISAFQGMSGILDSGRSIVEEGNMIDTASMYSDLIPEDGFGEIQELEMLALKVSELLEEEGFTDQVELGIEDRGLVMRFKDVVLFDLGSDELKEEPKDLLKRLSYILEQVPLPIRIEGHTDNLPINNLRFPSNWELSVARATRVVRFLIEEGSLAPDRLSALGFGEYRPIAPNTSAWERAKNRRVDIVVLRPSLAESEPGAAWLDELNRIYKAKPAGEDE